jgi:hypothetical protein
MLALSSILVVFMFLIMVCALLCLPARDPRMEEVPDGRCDPKFDAMTEATGSTVKKIETLTYLEFQELTQVYSGVTQGWSYRS